MTMSAATCSCERDLFPSFGPCPVHGSKWNRDELERYRRLTHIYGAALADIESEAAGDEREDTLKLNSRLRNIIVLARAALKPTEGPSHADD